MKGFLFAATMMILLFACKKGNRIPGDVLPKEKMQAVLWDLMRADQFVGDYILSRDTSLKKDSVRISYYKQILASYNITQAAFQKSFTYYSSHPALLGALLDSMSKIKAPSVQVVTPVAVDSGRADSNQRQSAIKNDPPPADSFFRGKKIQRPLRQN